MAVYADLFIATEAKVLSAPLDGHDLVEHFPTIQAKYITPLELSTLEAIVTGHADPYALLDARLDAWDDNVVRLRPDGNVMVERVPATLSEVLVGLTPDEIAQAARAWEDTDEMRAATNTSEHVAWLMAYLHEARQLARRAKAEGKQVYLWTAV